VLPETALAQLGSDGHFVIVGTCTIGPITADTIPSERSAFTRPSILFRPRRGASPGNRKSEIGNQKPETRNGFSDFRIPSSDFRAKRPGGGAGYRPRVRSAYYAAVYRHSSGKPEHVQYSGWGTRIEGGI
jgi:hypothetical protein